MRSDLSAVTYRLGASIYVALTNQCNAVALIKSRGPSFVMPSSSGFAPLPQSFEPSADQVVEAVRAALRSTQAGTESIVFAGAGEPLLRTRVLEESAVKLREALADDLPRLRLNTNGLVPTSEATEVAWRLSSKAHLSSVSVSIASADATQYDALMKPETIRYSPGFSLSLGHEEVCSFVKACVSEGLEVECTAVAAPDVDIAAARQLAECLGASFRERSYHA